MWILLTPCQGKKHPMCSKYMWEELFCVLLEYRSVARTKPFVRLSVVPTNLQNGSLVTGSSQQTSPATMATPQTGWKREDSLKPFPAGKQNLFTFAGSVSSQTTGNTPGPASAISKWLIFNCLQALLQTEGRLYYMVSLLNRGTISVSSPHAHTRQNNEKQNIIRHVNTVA